MKKRYFETALALLICAAVMCGCGNTTSEKTNVTPPQSDITYTNPDASRTEQPPTSSVSAFETESVPVSDQNSESDSSTPSTIGSVTSVKPNPASSSVPSDSNGSEPHSGGDESSTRPIFSSSQPSPSTSSLTPSSSTSSSTQSSSTPSSTQSSSTPSSTQSSSTPSSAQLSSTPSSAQSSGTPSSTSSSSKPVSSSTSTVFGTSPETRESLLDDYTQKWAYNQLDQKQRKIYQRLFECSKRAAASCDISDLGYTKDDLPYINTAFWAFDYDNPQFLELGSGYRYGYSINDYTGDTKMTSIEISYSRTASQIKQSEFDKTAQHVIAEARAQKSDYEKLKYAHDWIVNNTVYTNTDAMYEREADGPLVYGKAVCEGYAKAFMYFAQAMGFDCVCISGTANEPHMWNKVKLDGKWYNVDVTWDDPVSSSGDILRYNYFLISDSAIGLDHFEENVFVTPSAAESYVQQ